MANLLKLFMNEDDELAFLRVLERFRLEVYPRRVPPDWQPFRAGAATRDQLPEEDVYLCASEIGPAVVDKVKRGPDKGFWRIDEVRSPVIFWERCVLNEDSELLSGQLWAELDVTQQTGRRDAADERFRLMFKDLEAALLRLYRKGRPKPFLIGPHAARRAKEGSLKFRVREHLGGLVEVH